MDFEQDKRVDRRTFLKRGVVAGGVLAGAGLGIKALSEADGDKGPRGPAAQPDPTAHKPGPTRPNILVIMVDQLRYPAWFGASGMGVSLPPNLRRLREGGVSFGRHYTVSNDCSPSRSALLTGLYTHQTGCMITGGSTLDPGFPTYGTMLREHGYHTRWFGKWHVTHGDNRWTPETGEAALERYGFAGGLYPSPDGAPGQGWKKDPVIAARFREWFSQEAGREPWCTTVSFVNPHDIAWWYLWSDRVPQEAGARRSVHRLPPNFETPELLVERNKPLLQRSLQDTAAASFGPVPFTGPEVVPVWLDFLDLYAKLQRQVDFHIGSVIETLHSHRDVAENTVILFTSDHGEYGASHGLRGKGASAYEEGIHVPLIVKDNRGKLTSAPEQVRTQLTSSVDVPGLLLTIATGSDEWRKEEHYSQIAGRADLAAILSDPQAAGREYVLHATDETVTEFASEPYAAIAPLHVVAMRTAEAKFGLYSHWPEEGIEPLSEGQEAELYDYGNEKGRLELHNAADHSPLEASMRERLQKAFVHELRKPLPERLQAAHGRGFADYFSIARRAAINATARRRAKAEQVVGNVAAGQGGPAPKEGHAPGGEASGRRR